MTESDAAVLYDVTDRIATLTINRPRVMNAIDIATCLEFFEKLNTAAADDSLLALIVTGAGGRAFSAGADLADTAFGSMEDTWNRLMLEISRFPATTIAAVDGVAVGAGFSIALTCDMRIAGEGSRLGAIFVRRGLMPDTGSTFLLSRLTGRDQALKLMLTGRLIDAHEALRLGLVTEVVPQGEALVQARALATEIAANAPLPVRYTRRLLHESFARDFEQGLAVELPFVEECLTTHDAQEGGLAFLEKRTPIWQGR